MTRFILGTTLILGLSACGDSESGESSTGTAAVAAARADSLAAFLPRFTSDGKLIRPEGWETWVLAGTSMGLTYTEPAGTPDPGAPPGNFLNVYIQPWAYKQFMETGEFPEETMFVLAGSDPVRKADPARGGFYQGPTSLLEVHMKKQGLHESGWGFYGFGGGEESASIIPGDAACYTCHRDEAAYDQVFAQFYPFVRERLGLASVEGDSSEAGS